MRSHIRKWNNGDIAGFWVDMVALVNRLSGQRRPAFEPSEGLRAADA